MNYIITLLIAYGQPGAVPSQALAAEIVKVSVKYNLDAYDLTRIVLVESGGRPKAKNGTTHDYGIAQINIYTALAYKASQACLEDWKCNLDLAGHILADLQRSKHYRICHYNVGPKRDISKYCLRYEAKLAKVY